MKKVISLLLALVCCLSLCACGKTPDTATNEVNYKATISTNTGETVYLTAEDLFKAFDENEASFKKLYYGARIEFIGTVKNVKINTSVYDGEKVPTEQNKIVFEEGWCLIIGKDNTTYDLADFQAGQKLKVATGIVSAAYDTEFLQTVADNNRVVWLIGNDELHGRSINTQTTTITVLA